MCTFFLIYISTKKKNVDLSKLGPITWFHYIISIAVYDFFFYSRKQLLLYTVRTLMGRFFRFLNSPKYSYFALIKRKKKVKMYFKN